MKFKPRENEKGRKRDFPGDPVVMTLPCSGRNTSSIPIGEPRHTCEQLSQCVGVILMWGSEGEHMASWLIFTWPPWKGLMMQWGLRDIHLHSAWVKEALGQTVALFLVSEMFEQLLAKWAKSPNNLSGFWKTPWKPPCRTLCISAWDWNHYPPGLSPSSAKFLPLRVPDFALVFTSVKWITQFQPLAKGHLGETVAWSYPTASI